MGDDSGDLSKVQALVIRLDERVQEVQKDIVELRLQCVGRAEFAPVQQVVYGLAGLLLASVFVALITLVIK